MQDAKLDGISRRLMLVDEPLLRLKESRNGWRLGGVFKCSVQESSKCNVGWMVAVPGSLLCKFVVQLIHNCFGWFLSLVFRISNFVVSLVIHTVGYKI